MPDKRREIAFVHAVRRQYPWFPPGEIVESEKPDILLVDGDDKIGIEVTELFQPPKHGSRFGPHIVAKFHRQVMEIAEQRARDVPPVDVLVYFDYRHKLRDADKCAVELIEFIRSHAPGTYDQLARIPHGFSVVRIAEPVANQVPRWHAGDSGGMVVASWEMLADVISGKNRLVHAYRLEVPRVWLLIACSFADFANNFYLPPDADTWRFEYDFDKVLLLTSEHGVVNLLRVGA